MVTGRRRLVAAFLVLGLVPLCLLAAVSVRSGGRAVSDKVEDGLRLSARLSALYIGSELAGLGEVDRSFARRPTLVAAMANGVRTSQDRGYVRLALRQLATVRPGIATTFLADARGRLIDIVPATPSIVGKDFSYRDWYKGVTRTRRPYVSEAYRSLAAGRPLVVAVGAPVFAKGPNSRLLGILVAAYRLDQIEQFAERIGSAEHVNVDITDQRGTAITRSRAGLVSRRDDPLVAAALAGDSGLMEMERSGAEQVAAFAPVRGLGWTVVTSTPKAQAYSAVQRLNRKVLAIAGVLGLLLLAGIGVLNRVLRTRQEAEEEMEVALDTARRLADVNRAVLEAMEEGLLLVGVDGRVLSFNPRMRELAEEFAPGQLRIGGTLDAVREAIAPQQPDPEAYRAGAEESDAQPELHRSDTVVLGDRTFVRATAPVRDGKGALLGRIVTMREITAEREAERLKDELVATVSHELRTPLASIMGFAELLTEREYDPETQQRFLRTIRGESTRLTRLVNDFLDLQRIEAGRFTLALEPFDLVELAREQVDVFAGQSAQHDLVLHAPDEPVRALGERGRVAQVLANLLSNAIKYSPAGGRVDVRLELRTTAVRLSVADLGLGIPVAEQSKIFSKFFRVDTSDTREIGGTGLGLALCRELVEAHGGQIGFESVEGAGSTFWFELPTAVATREGIRPRILIVEDEPEAAALLRAYLEEGDYELDVVASGEDALCAVRERPPTVVLLDMALSGELDGFEVLSRLKADPATASIPIVVCTAGNGRNQAAALGAADFLAKPFTAEHLRQTVGRVLPRSEGSVLVVDDDVAVRALVSETLNGNGFELREAADGNEALAKIGARRPDAIILDLIMPRMNGFEVLDRLQARAETRSIPVIVLTGHKLSPTEQAMLRQRVVSLLEKNDYSSAELRALVGRALG